MINNDGKSFRTLKVNGWWKKDGYADIEWWERKGDTVTITSERVPFREYMDLPYLYNEIKMEDIKYLEEC